MHHTIRSRGMNGMARPMFRLHFNAFYKYTQLKLIPFTIFVQLIRVRCLLRDSTLAATNIQAETAAVPQLQLATPRTWWRCASDIWCLIQKYFDFSLQFFFSFEVCWKIDNCRKAWHTWRDTVTYAITEQIAIRTQQIAICICRRGNVNGCGGVCVRESS